MGLKPGSNDWERGEKGKDSGLFSATALARQPGVDEHTYPTHLIRPYEWSLGFPASFCMSGRRVCGFEARITCLGVWGIKKKTVGYFQLQTLPDGLVLTNKPTLHT